jgi:hypothetical protein
VNIRPIPTKIDFSASLAPTKPYSKAIKAYTEHRSGGEDTASHKPNPRQSNAYGQCTGLRADARGGDGRVRKELAQNEEFTAMSILQRLYDSEINFEVSSFYDAGFDVRLGDALNGFLAQGKVETWAEVETWLRDQALTHYPDSEFAKSAA